MSDRHCLWAVFSWVVNMVGWEWGTIKTATLNHHQIFRILIKNRDFPSHFHQIFEAPIEAHNYHLCPLLYLILNKIVFLVHIASWCFTLHQSVDNDWNYNFSSSQYQGKTGNFLQYKFLEFQCKLWKNVIKLWDLKNETRKKWEQLILN